MKNKYIKTALKQKRKIGNTRSTTEQNETNRSKTKKLKLQMFENTDAGTHRNIDARRSDINHKSIQTNQNHHNKESQQKQKSVYRCLKKKKRR